MAANVRLQYGDYRSEGFGSAVNTSGWPTSSEGFGRAVNTAGWPMTKAVDEVLTMLFLAT